MKFFMLCIDGGVEQTSVGVAELLIYGVLMPLLRQEIRSKDAVPICTSGNGERSNKPATHYL